MCSNKPLKSSMLILLVLLLLSHGASTINCSTLPGNSTDVLSLLDLKAANDLTGVLNSWNSSLNHCMWNGITCSLKHLGRVTRLDLARYGGIEGGSTVQLEGRGVNNYFKGTGTCQKSQTPHPTRRKT
ncbi:hypothetical protein ACQ4PT_003009 [Festuca glaucescens]